MSSDPGSKGAGDHELGAAARDVPDAGEEADFVGPVRRHDTGFEVGGKTDPDAALLLGGGARAVSGSGRPRSRRHSAAVCSNMSHSEGSARAHGKAVTRDLSNFMPYGGGCQTKAEADSVLLTRALFEQARVGEFAFVADLLRVDGIENRVRIVGELEMQGRPNFSG